jgi:hypothetical protein
MTCVEDLEHDNDRVDDAVDVGPCKAWIERTEALHHAAHGVVGAAAVQALNRARWLLLEVWLTDGSLDVDARVLGLRMAHRLQPTAADAPSPHGSSAPRKTKLFL